MSERSTAFTVRVAMLSDWSVGSGGGRQGSLDSVVERDSEGLPYAPATTVRGIWRDAAEQVAFGLDDGTAGRWSAVVEHLFGSQPAQDGRGADGKEPIPSRLILSDARLPCGLRARLRDPQLPANHQDGMSNEPTPTRKALRDALTLVKPGVGIDARSGRAATDLLRFEEVARQGAVLEARAEIVLSRQAAADEALVCLALASARFVERIGGNRRRGSGRCTMTIEPIAGEPPLPSDVAGAVERIVERGVPDIPQLRADPHRFEFTPGLAEGFVDVPLDVDIETPTVVAAAVLGNVVTSLDHIPGTMLLGGVARLLAVAGLDATRIGAALVRGDIRVLPAYPVVAGQRGLPVPFVFERKKDDTGGPDGKGALRNRLRKTEGDDQFSPLRNQYFAFDPEATELELAFGTTNRSTRTHNTVEDARQKPTQAVGGVYTYEAIRAGERLKSVIRLRQSLYDAVAHSLAAMRNPTGDVRNAGLVTIGRAKKAGYGAVQLTPREKGAAPPRTHQATNSFVLYAASDILLPPGPVVGADASPAGFLRAAIRDLIHRDVLICQGDVRTDRTDGWIARWGLPRPSYVVMLAGSAFEVKASNGSAFDPADLALLEREGVGLRRGEGFGHVMVDPRFLTGDLGRSGKFVEKKSADQVDRTPSLERHIVKFSDLIEATALREMIALRAEQAAAQERESVLRWVGKLPNMSQLGALRTTMGRLRSADDISRVRAFIANLTKTNRKSRWGDGELDDKHPLRVLEKLFAEPITIWDRIGIDWTREDWTVLVITRRPSDAAADPGLQRFAIASFLSAAMRVHKRTMEEKESA